MNGWFLAIIIWYTLSLSIICAKHGKPNESKYNFWSSLFTVGIMVTLTYFAIKAGF